MVDNLNPTNQFHPYQKPTGTPNSERQPSGFGSTLNGILNGGLGSIRNMNVQQPINKVRDYARAKPGMALGALAALAIGVGLLRGRR